MKNQGVAGQAHYIRRYQVLCTARAVRVKAIAYIELDHDLRDRGASIEIACTVGHCRSDCLNRSPIVCVMDVRQFQLAAISISATFRSPDSSD